MQHFQLIVFVLAALSGNPSKDAEHRPRLDDRVSEDSEAAAECTLAYCIAQLSVGMIKRAHLAKNEPWMELAPDTPSHGGCIA